MIRLFLGADDFVHAVEATASEVKGELEHVCLNRDNLVGLLILLGRVRPYNGPRTGVWIIELYFLMLLSTTPSYPCLSQSMSIFILRR